MTLLVALPPCYKSRQPYQVEKKGGCARGWCVRRESLRLSVKFRDVKFKDPKFKHEIFVRIDMKYSYFSNYFIIVCNQFFLLLKLHLNVCCLPKIKSCLCIAFKVTNLTLYMYLFIEIS